MLGTDLAGTAQPLSDRLQCFINLFSSLSLRPAQNATEMMLEMETVYCTLTRSLQTLNQNKHDSNVASSGLKMDRLLSLHVIKSLQSFLRPIKAVQKDLCLRPPGAYFTR